MEKQNKLNILAITETFWSTYSYSASQINKIWLLHTLFFHWIVFKRSGYSGSHEKPNKWNHNVAFFFSYLKLPAEGRRCPELRPEPSFVYLYQALCWVHNTKQADEIFTWYSYFGHFYNLFLPWFYLLLIHVWPLVLYFYVNLWNTLCNRWYRVYFLTCLICKHTVSFINCNKGCYYLRLTPTFPKEVNILKSMLLRCRRIRRIPSR